MIFDTVNFPFWMAIFPVVPNMGYTNFNLLDSPDFLQFLVTLSAVNKPLLPYSLSSAFVTLNIVRRFQSFCRRHSALVENIT